MNTEDNDSWSFPGGGSVWEGWSPGEVTTATSLEERKVAALERIANALERLAPTALLTVIDGEPCLVRDCAPPGAKLPNPDSGLFKFCGDMSAGG